MESDQEATEAAVACGISPAGAGAALRAACCCRLWRRASEKPEAWRGAVLTARKTAQEAAAGETADDIAALSDTALAAFVAKLRRVGERGGLSSVPPPALPGAVAARTAWSPLHAWRAEGAGREAWVLCYNTRDFGWFDREHMNVFPCGLKVWAPCPLMCRWLTLPGPPPMPASSVGPSIAAVGAEASSASVAGPACAVHGSSLLELGAGVGLLGFSASAAARRVVITDVDDLALRIARANARANGASNVQVLRLAYGRRTAQAFRAAHGRFDHVVAADVVYGLQVVAPLLESVDELLADAGLFSLGFVGRDDRFLAAIEAAAEGAGLAYVVPPCFLAAALAAAEGAADGAAAPARQETPERSLASTGKLAEFKKHLERWPKASACLGESAERVQILQFARRRAPAPAPFDLDALD